MGKVHETGNEKQCNQDCNRRKQLSYLLFRFLFCLGSIRSRKHGLDDCAERWQKKQRKTTVIMKGQAKFRQQSKSTAQNKLQTTLIIDRNQQHANLEPQRCKDGELRSEQHKSRYVVAACYCSCLESTARSLNQKIDKITNHRSMLIFKNIKQISAYFASGWSSECLRRGTILFRTQDQF